MFSSLPPFYIFLGEVSDKLNPLLGDLGRRGRDGLTARPPVDIRGGSSRSVSAHSIPANRALARRPLLHPTLQVLPLLPRIVSLTATLLFFFFAHLLCL